ncbi:PilZ domain-containing protein [Motiliproteus sediminis]|uniref:PilZ domain-containing protein n=1 Tax=Motiliproteus sediminis TaxID=1468178 RepID=UPI001AEFD2A0|nr:PilZ domain-containing protein [Motiliproteus sediminis]
MSHQISHPAGIPINCRCSATSTVTPAALQNISDEELCFQSPTPFDLCARVTLSIDLFDPPFHGEAWVIGCHPDGDRFEVRVRLLDPDKAFDLRMAEQLCHIEHYKRQRAQELMQQINDDTAAREWIERFAESFSRRSD